MFAYGPLMFLEDMCLGDRGPSVFNQNIKLFKPWEQKKTSDTSLLIPIPAVVHTPPFLPLEMFVLVVAWSSVSYILPGLPFLW